MEWEVEYTDQFEQWWDDLGSEEQEDVAAKVGLLERRGPTLGRPHVDTIKGSRHPNMKELIVRTRDGLTESCLPSMSSCRWPTISTVNTP